MILKNREIIEAVNYGLISITGFDTDQCGPNSYDLRLGDKILQLEPLYPWADDIDTHAEPVTRELKPIFYNGKIAYRLQPKQHYLGFTMERVKTCHFVPILHGRSTAARWGLQVHHGAGFGDLGFDGQWVLEIVNHNAYPIIVYPGDRVAQVCFETVEPIRDSDKMYSSTYLGQCGVRVPKILS